MYIPFSFLSNVNLAFNGVVEYLVVAGGAAGGGPSRGGGGGAGGVLTGSVIISPNTTYNFVVGDGGIYTGSENGSSSMGFNNSYIAIGGGTGGDFNQDGFDGGSGGGGSGGNLTGVLFDGGLGTVGQGFNGGFGRKHPIVSENATAGGGGGGASENGGDTTILLLDAFAGNGGDGITWLDGNSYGGGGGGCGPGSGLGAGGAGGLGGGGAGSTGDFNSPGGNGGVNTGGGGGGGRSDLTSPGGNGGSGVIKIRYTGPAKASGGTVTFDGVYTTHTFNSSSTFQTFDFLLPSGSVPVLPSKVFYNVTQCNTTSSFNIDLNQSYSPNVSIYSTSSILNITGSISGCFSVNSSTITSSLSGSITGVGIRYIFNDCNTCLTDSPPFPISGSLVIWSDTTSLTSSIWYDRSGKGNNGLVSGSTLVASGSLGYEFNGTNNYVTYPITLNGQPSSSYTLQYYGTLPSESVNRDFFVKQVYNNGWDTLFDAGSSPDRFVFRDIPGSDKRANITPTFASKQLITITANTTTDVLQLYVNDLFVTNFSAGGVNNFNSASVPFVFGFNTDGDATYWKGAVSDILLYNKVLSATEVSQSFAYLNLF
jgi:hypothetical protein